MRLSFPVLTLTCLALLLPSLSSAWGPFTPNAPQSAQVPGAAAPAVGPQLPPSKPAPKSAAPGPVAWALKTILRFNDTQIARIYDGEKLKKTRFVKDIDDDNWEKVLLGEQARGMVWVIDIYGKEDIHKLYSEGHVGVARQNSSAAGGDLQEFYKFGRFDYMKNDILTTLCLIFKPPILVVSHLPDDAPSPATFKDLDLRFYPLGRIPGSQEAQYQFLKEEIWREEQPWKYGYFSPDGPVSPVLLQLGKFFRWFHSITEKVPSWILLIVSGAVANLVLGWFHKGAPPATTYRQPATTAATPTAATQAKAPAVTPAPSTTTDVPAWGSSIKNQPAVEKAAAKPKGSNGKKRGSK